MRVVPHAAECGHTKPSAVVCSTTGKKQTAFRRRRYRPANADAEEEDDEGAPGYARRGTLKPYNAYTPLSELRCVMSSLRHLVRACVYVHSQ